MILSDNYKAVQHRVVSMTLEEQRRLLERLVKLLQVESVSADGTVTYKPPADNDQPDERL
jgi:hypothetical protein